MIGKSPSHLGTYLEVIALNNLEVFGANLKALRDSFERAGD